MNAMSMSAQGEAMNIAKFLTDKHPGLAVVADSQYVYITPQVQGEAGVQGEPAREIPVDEPLGPAAEANSLPFFKHDFCKLLVALENEHTGSHGFTQNLIFISWQKLSKNCKKKVKKNE